MGGYAGHRFLTLVLGLALCVSVACKKKVPQASLDPTSVPPPPASVSTPGSAVLDAANQYYLNGDYPQAISGYEEFLNSGGQRGEEVLLRLAVSYVLADNGIEKSGEALVLLEELSTRLDVQDLRHPQIQALLLLFQEALSLKRDVEIRDRKIKEISTQLQKLKEIDVKKPD